MKMSRETSLVTADWVAANLNDPKVVIVEVDEDTTLYAQGHIENAITFHWREDLQDGLIRDLISKEKFEALLSKSGISNDTTVVLYGGNNNWFATYAFWYFKVYGHADVRLLDGGRKRWELDARPFVTEVPVRTATTYVAKDRDNSIRAYRDEVIAAIVQLAFAYALQFDLHIPPFDYFSEISVEQIQLMGESLKLQTAKRLGFKMKADESDNI